MEADAMTDLNAPEPTHHSIDYIEIYVTNMKRSQQFYAHAFGWTFTTYAPTYAGIRRSSGGESGGLCVVESVTPGGPLVVLYSRDIEASLASVREAGAQITAEIYAFPGGRRFEFRDPDGTALAVWSSMAA